MNIYNLKLHERTKINTETEVLRVPGGWMYTRLASSNGLRPSSTFVPYDNGFDERETAKPEKPT